MENEVLSFFGGEISWAEAFAIVGTIFAVVLGVSSYFIRFFAAKKGISHETKMASMEKDIEVINKEIQSLRNAVEIHDARDQADFTRVEEKIDNLNNLFIEFLQGQIRKE